MVSTLLVAGLLAAVAIGTFWWQAEAWKSQQQAGLAPFETDFYRRRNRRRSQISGLLGLVALAVAAGVWIRDPLVTGFYWLGVLVLLVWIILLAMVDAAASHAYFARVRSRQLAEQAALHRQALDERRGPDNELS